MGTVLASMDRHENDEREYRPGHARYLKDRTGEAPMLELDDGGRV